MAKGGRPRRRSRSRPAKIEIDLKPLTDLGRTSTRASRAVLYPDGNNQYRPADHEAAGLAPGPPGPAARRRRQAQRRGQDRLARRSASATPCSPSMASWRRPGRTKRSPPTWSWQRGHGRHAGAAWSRTPTTRTAAPATGRGLMSAQGGRRDAAQVQVVWIKETNPASSHGRLPKIQHRDLQSEDHAHRSGGADAALCRRPLVYLSSADSTAAGPNAAALARGGPGIRNRSLPDSLSPSDGRSSSSSSCDPERITIRRKAPSSTLAELGAVPVGQRREQTPGFCSFQPSDFRDNRPEMHHSPQGMKKYSVASRLQFFEERNPTTREWFVKK